MEEQKKQTINIYTDGACSGNQFEKNAGGWGVILEYGGHIKENFGGEPNTTNNRMEMTALIEGLSSLTKKNYNVWVFSDSSYLINCFQKRWYEKWERNGWLTSGKKPVENRDLWEKLLVFLPDYEFSFFHIKGHISKSAREATLRSNYARFTEKNGKGFSYENFLEIAKYNRRADELASFGASGVRA